ncbi:hypothetical protein N8I77_002724 [Diaporthe amygdali]|uniref:Protein kinase domain-containing protein n=1 Tax=Phomopsis amygdali TaxID=1214568 RepID=A0AAD9SUI2_PHOAM|nr:hypothetical protein N8I77_002724 [Diaporthe amygdali]
MMDPKQYPAGQLQQPTSGSQGRAAEWAGLNNATSTAHTDLDKTDLRTIKSKLQDGRKQSVALVEDYGDQFLPRNLIEDILTEPTIQSLLLEKDTTSRIRLNTIIGDKERIKIFTILVLMKRTKHLRRIIRRGFWDDDLPLSKRSLESIFPTLQDNSSFVDRFIIHQSSVAVPAWDFTTPDMEEKDYPLRFHNMPFLKKQKLSNGGQGLIWKVEIHPAHFIGTRTGSNRWERFHRGPEFAVKEFSKEEEFKQELSALKCFHQPKTKHKHLIRVLAAYSQGRSHFLILPLAEGNLVEFLNQDSPLSKDPIWLLRQCYGLTGGLRRIHKCKTPEVVPSSHGRKFLRGRHGDIKPPNILWFADDSTGENRLVLSDFTLMRFHAQGSETDTLVDRVGRTRTYRAPELDFFPSSDSRVSQKYDVWSLGCVFLELISCHLVGYKATRGDEKHFDDESGRGYETFSTTRVVEDFAYEDKYFIHKRGERTAEVKQSVKDWFSYLRRLKHCSAALSDFLDLIQNHMLVINPDARWGSKKVLRRLKEIQNQNSNPEKYYWSAGARGTFHPSPFLRPWDESSYDRRLLYHLNDKANLLAFSGLNSSVDLEISALPDRMKHDMELFDATFIAQSFSSSGDGPSRSQTTTTTGTDTAPEVQSHTGSETSSIPDDASSREASIDLARSSCQDDRQQPLFQLDTTVWTPKLVEEASSMGSLHIYTECTQHDASKDAQFLRTPSRSHGPSSSEATSIFTQDMRRSISSCTGQSTLDPDDISEQIQSAVKSIPGPEKDAIGHRAADEDLPGEDGGESDYKAKAAKMGSSPNEKLAIRKTWASLRKRFEAVWKRDGKRKAANERK